MHKQLHPSPLRVELRLCRHHPRTEMYVPRWLQMERSDSKLQGCRRVRSDDFAMQR